VVIPSVIVCCKSVSDTGADREASGRAPGLRSCRAVSSLLPRREVFPRFTQEQLETQMIESDFTSSFDENTALQIYSRTVADLDNPNGPPGCGTGGTLTHAPMLSLALLFVFPVPTHPIRRSKAALQELGVALEAVRTDPEPVQELLRVLKAHTNLSPLWGRRRSLRILENWDRTNLLELIDQASIDCSQGIAPLIVNEHFVDGPAQGSASQTTHTFGDSADPIRIYGTRSPFPTDCPVRIDM
jgi:hypothetical protein